MSELLDLAEEALHEVALPAQMRVVLPWRPPIGPGRDDRDRPPRADHRTNSSASYPLSAIRWAKGVAGSRATAWVMSWVWPPVSVTRRGFPSASTLTWTLLVKPPRLRPNSWAAWPPFCAKRQPHTGGRGPRCYPEECVPYRGHRGTAGTSAPRHPSHTTGESACRRCSTSHSVREGAARGRRCGPSRGCLPGSGGSLSPAPRTHPDTDAKTRGSLSIGRDGTLLYSCLSLRLSLKMST